MGEGPVARSEGGSRPSWKIKAPDDTRVQGIVVSGFAHLRWAEALFLSIGEGDGAGGRRAGWLGALREIEPVTDATGKDPDPAAIAFTWYGLFRMGLPKEALESFSVPFREGMCQVDRLRRLGDCYDGEWQRTVIDGGPIWSGNTPLREVDDSGPHDPEDEEQTPEEAIPPAEKTVHALLLLYDSDQKEVGRRAREVARVLAPFGVGVVRQLPLDLRFDERGIAREHFGFADGVSQPVPYGEAIVLEDGSDAARDPWHGVPAGEILMGHVNAHHERAPGPVLKETGAERFGLEPHQDEQGFLDLGRNGTYMVVRELRQDVAAFWNSLDAGAARINAHDPSKNPIDARWLAERVVGRHPDGHLLCPSGYYASLNDIGFYKDDPHGHGCPLGSHVRRANPRDGLAPDPASAPNLLDSANNHRILRRGRKYGTTIDDPRRDDGEDRGLLFICLNTDIVRQFEFVQQTWILNRSFADLYDETDPLIGPRGPFTIREQPLRRIVEVDTFVRLAGGEYFFLPSLPALAYLESL